MTLFKFKLAGKCNPTMWLGEEENLVHRINSMGLSSAVHSGGSSNSKSKRELPLPQTTCLKPSLYLQMAPSLIQLVILGTSESSLILPFSYHPHQIHYPVLLIEPPCCILVPRASSTSGPGCSCPGPGCPSSHQDTYSGSSQVPSFLPLHAPLPTV